VHFTPRPVDSQEVLVRGCAFFDLLSPVAASCEFDSGFFAPSVAEPWLCPFAERALRGDLTIRPPGRSHKCPSGRLLA